MKRIKIKPYIRKIGKKRVKVHGHTRKAKSYNRYARLLREYPTRGRKTKVRREEQYWPDKPEPEVQMPERVRRERAKEEGIRQFLKAFGEGSESSIKGTTPRLTRYKKAPIKEFSLGTITSEGGDVTAKYGYTRPLVRKGLTIEKVEKTSSLATPRGAEWGEEYKKSKKRDK